MHMRTHDAYRWGQRGHASKQQRSVMGVGDAEEESAWSGMGTVDGWRKGETFFQGFPRGCCF